MRSLRRILYLTLLFGGVCIAAPGAASADTKVPKAYWYGSMSAIGSGESNSTIMGGFGDEDLGGSINAKYEFTIQAQLNGVSELRFPKRKVADRFGYSFTLNEATTVTKKTTTTCHTQYSGSSNATGSKRPGKFQIGAMGSGEVKFGAAAMPVTFDGPPCHYLPNDENQWNAGSSFFLWRLSCLTLPITGNQHFEGIVDGGGNCIISPSVRPAMTVEYNLTRVPTDRLKIWVKGKRRTIRAGQTTNYRVKVKNTSLRFAEKLVVCLESSAKVVSGRGCQRVKRLPGGNIKLLDFSVTSKRPSRAIKLRFEARAKEANKVTKTTKLKVKPGR